MKIEIKCKASTEIPLEKLVEFQGKLKKLAPKNLDKLKKRILADGFIAPIFVWENEGKFKLMDGHQRLAALNSLKKDGHEIPPLPVAMIEAEDEQQARARLLSITSSYGEFNSSELDAWISQLDKELTETLRFSNSEMKFKSPLDDTEGDDEVEDKVDPVTVPGDIYELGPHRLVCGDATLDEDLRKLMGDDMADIILTDPPYNVAYEGKTKEALTIQNDSMDDSSFKSFLVDVFVNLFSYSKPGAAIYVFHADMEGVNFRTSFTEAGFKLSECLVWVKNVMVMGRQDYHWQHEPILYGWNSSGGHEWYTGRQETTTLFFDRPSANKEHPTMKPIDILIYLLNNSSMRGQIVLDTFGGSGSTLIAAEKSGRLARLTELDPHYCDVIVNRYVIWCRENGRECLVTRNGEKIDWA